MSCALPNSNIKTNNVIYDFNEDLSFDEFEKLLIHYANTNPYPNIDQ